MEGVVSHTVQYCAVSREKAVLERLLVIARLESILPCDDVVDVFAGKERHLVATVPVKDAEKGELLGVVLGLLGIRGEQV